MTPTQVAVRFWCYAVETHNAALWDTSPLSHQNQFFLVVDDPKKPVMRHLGLQFISRLNLGQA